MFFPAKFSSIFCRTQDHKRCFSCKLTWNFLDGAIFVQFQFICDNFFFFLFKDYMLDTDPTKRPDIFQVSHLIFALAEKASPIKNINVILLVVVVFVAYIFHSYIFFFVPNPQSSEYPNFNQLTMPLTESEWRKNITALNQLKKQSHLGSTEGISTTVNPRERPKANNANAAANPMISLAPGAANILSVNCNSANSRLRPSLPIKPPLPTGSTSSLSSSPQQLQTQLPSSSNSSSPFSNNNSSQQASSNQLLGFDDDFNFLNTPNSTQPEQQACTMQSISKTPLNSISNVVSPLSRSPQLLQPAPSEKKTSHRRSVSQ